MGQRAAYPGVHYVGQRPAYLGAHYAGQRAAYLGAHYVGQRPAYPGAHYAGQRPAYLGNILTKFLTLVFPSVRDTATTLETLCQLSAYQKNRFMVQQIHMMDG